MFLVIYYHDNLLSRDVVFPDSKLREVENTPISQRENLTLEILAGEGARSRKEKYLTFLYT